ncbi:MAG: hypothetical protein ABSE70_11915 [Candidatus Limnocylindrales bacterium]
METRIWGQSRAALEPVSAMWIADTRWQSGTPSTCGFESDFEGKSFPGQQSILVDAGSAHWQTSVVGNLGMVEQFGDALRRLGAKVGVDLLSAPTAAVLPARRQQSGTSALDAVDAIGELFELPMEAVTAMAGIGRTTPMYWRRTGTSPRPSTVRELWRLYGMAMSLQAALGTAGTRSWLRSGAPSPLSVLEAQDLGKVERLVARVAFNPAYVRAFNPAVETNADFDVEVGSGAPARASRRRVRRGRLG